MIDWSKLKLAITKDGLYNTTTGEKLWSAYSDRRYYSPQDTTLSADWSWLKLKQGWKSYLSNNGDIPFITTENSADDITKAEQDIWEFSNANHLIRKAVVTGVFPDYFTPDETEPDTTKIDDFLSEIKRKETT